MFLSAASTFLGAKLGALALLFGALGMAAMGGVKSIPMACPPSISAALRACYPCPAAPPVRHLILADRVSESRAQPGMMVNVKLTSVDARDSLGRIAHVRGIYVRAFAQFTAGATNDAVLAYDLRSLFYSLRLEDITGHPFWPDIEARNILDDSYFRHGKQLAFPALHAGTQTGAEAPYGPTVTADYGIATNVGAGTVTRDVSWWAPLSTMLPGVDPFAGMLPLASLQRQSDQGAFRFRLGTSLAGSPAGMQLLGFLNGEYNAGIDVWLDVVYLPVLAIGPTWTLDCYTLPEMNGVLRAPESITEYATVRFFPEDDPNGESAGRAAANNVGIWNLDIAGFSEMSGLSLVDAMTRMALFDAFDADSATERMNAAQSLPLIDYAADPNSWIAQAMLLVPFRPRGMGPAAGPLVFKWSQTTGDYVRYLHRYVDCNEQTRAAKLSKAVNCDPCSAATIVDGRGQVVSQGGKASTILVADQRVKSAG